MKLEHFVITRFSYRGKDAFKDIGGPTWYSLNDPLNPSNLDLRFKLFEIACLPSLKAQSCRDFGWMIIIDKDLMPSYRDRLAQLIEPIRRVYLHEYDPDVPLQTSQWMERYIRDSPDYILTTNLDDDDALPSDYVRLVQSHVHEFVNDSRLPPCKVIGAKEIIQWDLVTSRKAPLGWKCAWHRARKVASCGFSLLCKYPEYDFNVLGLRHGSAENSVDFANPPKNANVKFFREHLEHCSLKDAGDPDRWKRGDMFYDISRDVGAVLMTNHCVNDQIWRVYEKKTNCESVKERESFPGFMIDWERVSSYASSFKRSPRRLITRLLLKRLSSLFSLSDRP